MAEFFHGVRTSKQVETTATTPSTTKSGLPFVIGTAPVHMTGGSANQPVYISNYHDAVTQFGYSSDWKSFDLCEAMDALFQKYGCTAAVFVNVLNPEKHKQSVSAVSVTLADRTAKLPSIAIKETVVVTNGAEHEPVTYAAGTDYELMYDTEHDALILETTKDGTISPGASLSITYDVVDPAKVTAEDVIGGQNLANGTVTGLEVLEKVFPLYRVIPDLLLAPKWSSNPQVAAVLAAKAEGIHTIFPAKAIIDADCSTVTDYRNVPKWKTENSITESTQILCWPMVKNGSDLYHMSLHLAGVMATIDEDNGNCPCESPSNKSMTITATVLADGRELPLDITQANYLNSQGICTALNFVNGFTAWGNYTACYPAVTDAKECMIPVARTFDWVARSIIFTYWGKLDSGMNRRLIDSIIDALNIWLNGLTTEGKILGGRVEYISEENPNEQLLAGKINFHVFLTPAVPAQEINFVLAYDKAYLEAAFAE